MRNILRALGGIILRFVRRFLSGTPNNSYEQIVFGAARSMASNFGRAVA